LSSLYVFGLFFGDEKRKDQIETCSYHFCNDFVDDIAKGNWFVLFRVSDSLLFQYKSEKGSIEGG